MKVTALIPARLSSSRFDRKLMMDLCGKSVILRTYEAVVNTNLFDSVYVVTEDEEIYDEIHNSGGNSILSKNQHESGSDRIAEACESISSDAFVNIQGDEPFIDANSLKKLVEELHNSDYVSLMIKISEIFWILFINIEDAWSRADIPLHAKSMFINKIPNFFEIVDRLKLENLPIAFAGDIV